MNGLFYVHSLLPKGESKTIVYANQQWAWALDVNFFVWAFAVVD